MLRKFLTPLLVAASLSFSAGALRADSYLYVQDGVFLNARSGPGTRYTAYQRLRPGTRLSIITKQGNWAQIRTPEGAILWVSANYLINRRPRVELSRPPIILRPQPPRVEFPKPLAVHPLAPMRPGLRTPPRAGDLPNTTPPGFYQPNRTQQHLQHQQMQQRQTQPQRFQSPNRQLQQPAHPRQNMQKQPQPNQNWKHPGQGRQRQPWGQNN
ncbi:SH3 domain-containing protein [Pseudodonghicola xiamenensis]|uniref:SH3b domain-containing protein n=1 Tax=Pseudodonghicola xiamenensis TaxID=337702 RepID=A0A8J3H705_9RHOB|nr:SH3 domain-containing protein [Pseudodonghicola xiamenensis]GHG94719.1 hypothetical protein GCM10010961_27880 [Pseudodonghicola xiamenensis]